MSETQAVSVFLSHFCEIHGPSILMVTSLEDEIQESHQDTPPSPDCCSSLHNVSVSTPSRGDKGPYFVSRGQSHIPAHLYSRIRRACLRSLSVEVCPGGEGAVLFPDGEDGNVVSYVFRISDVRARGSRRLIALCFLASDRDGLLINWDEIVGQLHRTAAEWRARAHRRYLRERQTEPQEQPQRNKRAPWVGGDAVPHRQGNLRSFPDLFSMPELGLWYRLHVSHCVALMSYSRRRAEVLVAPVSIHTPLVSSDDIVDDCDCVEVDYMTGLLSLDVHALSIIIYNALVGNQVIIRSRHGRTAASIVNWLSSHLPPQCSRCIPYTDTYSDVWMCNFIGLHPDSKMPRHAKPPEYAIVDIVCPHDSVQGHGISWDYSAPHDEEGGYSLPALPGADAADFFASFDIGTPPSEHDDGIDTHDTQVVDGHQWICSGTGCETILGRRIVECVLDTSISDATRSATLAALKLEWIAKAQVLAQFLQQPDAINHLHQFLEAISCTLADLPIIRFWSTAYRVNSDDMFVEIRE